MTKPYEAERDEAGVKFIHKFDEDECQLDPRFASFCYGADWAHNRAQAEIEFFKNRASLYERKRDQVMRFCKKNSLLKSQLEIAKEALKEVVCEGHSNLCESMKPYREHYTCHNEIASEALSKLENEGGE